MPEIVEGGEISGFDRDHSVVCGAPDVGVFSDDLDILGQVLLELFPACGRLLLISLCQGSYAIEDEEREYQRIAP